MKIDPFEPATLEDPYALYSTLRRDAPVYQLPQTGIWLVSRHEDLVEAAARTEDFSSHISAIVYAGEGGNPAVIAGDPDAIGAVDVLATQDPPAHTDQRRLMNRTFVHARIAALEPMMRSLVQDALDRAGDTIEWMEAVANPLPLNVIGDMLGMPTADLSRLKGWADAGVDLLSGVAPPERMAEAWASMIVFLDHLRARLGSPRVGSVTADVADAVARGDLSDKEGVSLLLQLVIAGSESTASLIGSAARILAQDASLQSSLRSDPSGVPAFLEETLRLESPFRGHFRVTTRETSLGGVTLPEGARVMLLWGSANRDEDAFAAAARSDPAREHLKRHVAFGSGIHFCIGAPLARLEARIAIERLLASTTSFEPVGALRHVPSMFVRRLDALPLRLER